MSNGTPRTFPISPRAAAGLLLFAWAALLLAKLLGPPDLMANDQEKVAAYAMDAYANGNWIVMRDHEGAVMSKPPLATWITGAFALALGGVNRLALVAPSALAVLLSAALVLVIGWRWLTPAAGLLGAFAALLNPYGLKALGLVRTDPLFMGTTFLASILVWRAWVSGRGWTWAWLALAAATLAKAPIALPLAAAGLLASLWERRTHAAAPVRGGHAAGISLYVAITAGWFLAAYGVLGDALVEKQIGDELVGHAVKKFDAVGFFAKLFKPSLYYLSRTLPWAPLFLAALWLLWKHPPEDRAARLLLRFLACGVLGGVAFFSVFPHQRADHLMPLMPGGMLLAGWAAERLGAGRLLTRLGPRAVPAFAAAALAAAAILSAAARLEARGDRDLIASANMERLASAIRAEAGGSPEVRFVEAPYALQYHLGVMRPVEKLAAVAGEWAGPGRVVAAVRKEARLRAALPADAPVHLLAGGEEYPGKSSVLLFSNQPGAPPPMPERRLPWWLRGLGAIGALLALGGGGGAVWLASRGARE
ncbi:MAG: glycosyltransferase family 39 protein [Candidatus Sumerlaeia bacterium]|nr:glycosyltransferase family 39 protein [Candidatus Sumerlaeia bacterium]